jgi:hypothetical protein
MAKVVGTWEGGRVVEKSDGTRVYYIRKRLAGKLYEVSTGATTLKAALAHLQRFQANPEGYSASGALPGQPVTIQAFQREYLAYCKTKGNSQDWITQKRRYLSWWREAFPGDLAPQREKLLICVNGQRSSQPDRVAQGVLFVAPGRCGVLPKGEDATLDLAIPALNRRNGRSSARSRAGVRQDREHVDPACTDILTMIAEPDAHTEAARLAKGQGSVLGTTLDLPQGRCSAPHGNRAARQAAVSAGQNLLRLSLMKAIKEASRQGEVER